MLCRITREFPDAYIHTTSMRLHWRLHASATSAMRPSSCFLGDHSNTQQSLLRLTCLRHLLCMQGAQPEPQGASVCDPVLADLAVFCVVACSVLHGLPPMASVGTCLGTCTLLHFYAAACLQERHQEAAAPAVCQPQGVSSWRECSSVPWNKSLCMCVVLLCAWA